MRFTVGTRLEYQVAAPSTFIFNVQALGGLGQMVERETLEISVESEVEHFEGDHGRARFIRCRVPAAQSLEIVYSAVVDAKTSTVAVTTVEPTPVARNPPEVLPYLLPSRYCESDRLGRLAWQSFGHHRRPYEQVSAICEWIHGNVAYVRGSSQATTSAAQTLIERAGVCRDFAHLGIALCRALNLPARYASGYACGLEPPDLHAWFEVAIGGRWVVFDATRIAPLNGLVRVGLGRDAADVAIATIFGEATLTRMHVQCEPVEGAAFQPWPLEPSREQAVVSAPAGDVAVPAASSDAG